MLFACNFILNPLRNDNHAKVVEKLKRTIGAGIQTNSKCAKNVKNRYDEMKMKYQMKLSAVNITSLAVNAVPSMWHPRFSFGTFGVHFG